MAFLFDSKKCLLKRESPRHRLTNAGLKGFVQLPAQFALDLACVDGVAAIVAGAILHMGGSRFVTAAVGLRA